jgi:hypothetical protein
MKKISLALLAALFLAPSFVKADEMNKPASSSVTTLNSSNKPVKKHHKKHKAKKDKKAKTTDAAQ